MNLILDIETTTKHDRIFLAVTKNLDTGEILCHTESNSLKPLIEAAELIIGHNAINFDLYLLQKLWKIPTSLKNCFDTLIASRLAKPDRQGGHSLANWGKILNFPKGDFHDFDQGLTPEMITYCKQDVELTEKVYNKLVQEFKMFRFSEQSIELEHDVARIIGEQEKNGFQLDVIHTLGLLSDLRNEMNGLEEDFSKVVPNRIKQLKTKVKEIAFNPGSRQQIGEYLLTQGWKPATFTDTGKPVVDESTLKGFDHPIALKFQQYLMLQKRVAQVESWLEASDSYGVVHGKVSTNGAVTGRMTHYSPNMAQVPKASKKVPYGAECRACFIPKKGKVLVGIDASGLELRMVAHYMKDEKYAKAIIEGKQENCTDIHSVNQRAAGLETRDQAKTFIYAFLYGAGPEKIGSIVGGSKSDGERLVSRFLEQTPNLQALRKRVARIAKEGSLPGLDGRVLWVRSEHSALNTLLQGAGAIVMKQALVFFKKSLDENGYDYGFCANIHDEWQVECRPEDAEHIGQLGVNAIEYAGKHLGLRCPLTGEYKIGQNWSQTH